MRFLTVLFLLAFIAFSVPSLSLFADDKVTDKAEKPDVKDKTKYDLTPKFTKDMKWKESIVLMRTEEHETKNSIDKYVLSAEVSVLRLKNSKPTKLKYEKFGGKEYSYHEYKDESKNDDEDSEGDEIEETDVEFNVDEKLMLSNAGKNALGQYQTFYPCGNLIGFEYPVEGVKVGDKWGSKELIPINVKFQKELLPELDIEVSHIESKFSLSKVDNDKIAYISWNGKCTIKIHGRVINFTWEGTILFDVRNNRLVSTQTKINSDIVGADEKMIFDVSRKLEYTEPSAEKPDNKPEVAPKTDDDE